MLSEESVSAILRAEKIPCGVLEDCYPLPFFGEVFTGPVGMVGSMVEGFWVWHEAEYSTGRVAHARDGIP